MNVTIVLTDEQLDQLAQAVAEIIRPTVPRAGDVEPALGRWLTVTEAAKLIGAPVSYVNHCRGDGRLTPHKRGSRAVVDRDELPSLIRVRP